MTYQEQYPSGPTPGAASGFRTRTTWLFSLLTLAAIAAGAWSCTSTPILVHGIPNLSCVDSNANIWVGGQPTPAGFEWLKMQHVTNDVKLNLASEGDDDYALKLAITVRAFPISKTEQMLGPTTNKMNAIVASITRDTIVHCENGWDRSRLAVAIWHREHGWTKAQAERDMLKAGFHRELLGLDWYWRTQVP